MASRGCGAKGKRTKGRVKHKNCSACSSLFHLNDEENDNEKNEDGTHEALMTHIKRLLIATLVESTHRNHRSSEGGLFFLAPVTSNEKEN